MFCSVEHCFSNLLLYLFLTFLQHRNRNISSVVPLFAPNQQQAKTSVSSDFQQQQQQRFSHDAMLLLPLYFNNYMQVL